MSVSIKLPETTEREQGKATLDDLGIDYESVVSRQRLFTVEFERTLSSCVEQYKNIKSKANKQDRIVRCINTVCNNTLTVARLDELKKSYVPCSYCSNVSHCSVEGYSSPRLSIQNEGETDNNNENRKHKKRHENLQNLVHRKNRFRATLPNIFLYSTKSMLRRIRGSTQKQLQEDNAKLSYDADCGIALSNYIICLERGKNKPEDHTLLSSLFDAGRDAIAYVRFSLLPIFKIIRVSIVITVAQWILFIARIIFSSNHSYTEYEESVMFGAFSSNHLREDIAIFRIFTSTFFHNSAAHLVIGTIMHFRFSSVFERIHGATVTLLMYFLCSGYGMLGVSSYATKELQANGFAGDWGVAGALLSRYFIFPYLIYREYQHIPNTFVSLICLLFVKTIKAESSILVSTHLLSGLAGFCFGMMINNRLRGKVWCRITNLMVDLICSLILLGVPIASVFVLFLINPTIEGGAIV